jgi:hypothetical protein
MLEYNNDLDRVTGAEMVVLLRGWNKSETTRRRKERSLHQVKDFDVAGDVSDLVSESRMAELSKPMSRNSFTWHLTTLQENFDPSSAEGQFGIARVEGLIAYIEAFERRVNYPSLAKYLEKTLALPIRSGSPVSYQPIPQEMLDRQRRKVFSSFPGGNFDRDNWARFIEFEAIPVEELEATFKATAEKFTPLFRNLAGLSEGPEFRIVIEDKPDVSWFNWTKADETGTEVTINSNERQKRRRFRGSEEQLVVHELGVHATEGELIKLGIEQRLINAMLGISTVPGVEQWHNEGFGNSIDVYDDDIYDSFTPQGRFAMELRRLETWVMRNAHIWINEYPEDMDKIVGYVLDQLPNFSKEAVKQNLGERLRDPESRSYLAAYGSSYEHVQFAKRLQGEVSDGVELPPFLRREDRRKELARFMMEQPRLPMQIYKKVEELDRASVIRT